MSGNKRSNIYNILVTLATILSLIPFNSLKIYAACSHSNYDDIYQTSRYEQKSGDDRNHYLIHVFNRVCSDCGTTIKRGIENKDTQAHDFSGNTCTKCEYVKTCSHSDYYEVYQNSKKYEQKSGDDRNHYLIQRVNLICSDCGATIKKGIEDKENQPHSFNGNTCSQCGYTKVCSHSNTKDIYQTTKGCEQKPGDNQNHYLIHLYNRVCKDCGAVVESNLENREIKPHNFIGNTCKDCRYVKISNDSNNSVSQSNTNKTECLHTNTDDIYKTTKGCEQKPGNNQNHYLIHLYNRICKDCGVVVKSNLENKEIKPHNFIGNTCKDCRYVKISNDSNNSVSQNNTNKTECLHTNTDDIYKTTKGCEQKPGDNQNHYLIHLYNRICKDCGVVVKSNLENKEIKPHNFIGNTCKDCQYVRASNNTNNNVNDNPNNQSNVTKPAPISYKFKEDGNYVFVNNPEGIFTFVS